MNQPARIGALPPDFARAVHEFTAFDWDGRCGISELEPPARIAPYAVAVNADIESNDSLGRMILLYDPAGNPAWEGTFRCVSFARADLPAEMVRDPCLAEVGWSWLTEALDTHQAPYVAASGTVTATSSTSFGTLRDRPPTGDIEIRGSWTPRLSPMVGLDRHLAAWQDLLLHVAGLPCDPTVVLLNERIVAPR